MNINFNRYAVRTQDGSVDKEGTLKKFSDEFGDWLAAQQTAAAQVEPAVMKVFAQYPDTPIPVPAIVSYAMGILNMKPSQFRQVHLKVLEFVRQSDRFERRKDGITLKAPAELPPPPPPPPAPPVARSGQKKAK